MPVNMEDDMSDVDRVEVKQLVRDLRAEASAYNRQWYNWLSIASGGGAVAILSFSANLPDPDFALRKLLPTLIVFASGICFSGLSLFAAARRVATAELHHAAAFTRDELSDAISSIPLMISSPPRVAERHNAPRDHYIGLHDEQHVRAELAWSSHTRWKFANRLFLCLALGGFVAGIILPLAHIVTGGEFAPTRSTSLVR